MATIASTCRAFPLEIFIMIGNCFILPDPYDSSLEYTIDDDDLTTIEALHNFAYTCRDFYNVFEPVLNRFLIIHERQDMYKAFLFFAKHPQVCRQVRHVFLRATVESAPQVAQESWNRRWEKTMQSHPEFFDASTEALFHITKLNGMYPGWPGVATLAYIFSFTLALLPKTETISLRGTVLAESVIDTMEMMVNHASSSGSGYLPALKTLRLGDTEPKVRALCRIANMATEQFQNLRKLIVHGVYGMFAFDEYPDSAKADNLEELYIRAWSVPQDFADGEFQVRSSLKSFLKPFSRLSVLDIEFEDARGPRLDATELAVWSREHVRLNILRLKNCSFPLSVIEGDWFASFKHLILEDCHGISAQPNLEEIQMAVSQLREGAIFGCGLEHIEVNGRSFRFKDVSQEGFTLVETESSGARHLLSH